MVIGMICKECGLEVQLNYRSKDNSVEVWNCDNAHFVDITDEVHKERAKQILRSPIRPTKGPIPSLGAVEYWLREGKTDWRDFTVEQLATEFKELWESPEFLKEAANIRDLLNA
jgi:hypothetical protein